MSYASKPVRGMLIIVFFFCCWVFLCAFVWFSILFSPVYFSMADCVSSLGDTALLSIDMHILLVENAVLRSARDFL